MPSRSAGQSGPIGGSAAALGGLLESPLMKRRAAITLLGAPLPLLLLAGCAGLSAPREVRVSSDQLQKAIERQFPQQRRLLEIVDVTVARPVLRMLPERNRIATDLDLSAAERLSGRVVRGRMALEYALRYEPSDASVRITAVRVQDVQLQLDAAPLSASGTRIAGLLAERLLEDFVLYRADAERVRLLQQLGISTAEVEVLRDGLVLRFVASQ